MEATAAAVAVPKMILVEMVDVVDMAQSESFGDWQDLSLLQEQTLFSLPNNWW